MDTPDTPRRKRFYDVVALAMPFVLIVLYVFARVDGDSIEAAVYFTGMAVILSMQELSR